MQYDFPKQEAVIQFVIEAIQAEAFNPKTLFLIGSYTIGNYPLPLSACTEASIIQAHSILLSSLLISKDISNYMPSDYFCLEIGKERLYVEVARVLRKKVFINAAKLRILECLGIPNEDMQWFTTNEQESHIHIVPMWTLASFKRLKHISNQYMVSSCKCLM